MKALPLSGMRTWLLIVNVVIAYTMLTCTTISATLPLDVKIAFNYADEMTAEEIAYLAGFDVVVTGAFVKDAVAAQLRAKGAKLIYYDWLAATYYCPSGNSAWDEAVYSNRLTWTLDPNPSDPNPMGGQYGCLDLFYDMANQDMISKRAAHLVNLVKSRNYDGVFFDWGSGFHALEEREYFFATDEFARRHPGVDYDDGVNDFLAAVKSGGLIVIMNTAYRSYGSKLVLHADIDVAEALITSDENDDGIPEYTIYVQGEGLKNEYDSWFNRTQRAVHLATTLPAASRAVNPDVRFLFLNYVTPFYAKTGETVTVNGQTHPVYVPTVDRQAVYFGMASSLIGGATAFAGSTDVGIAHTMDDVYLYDMGSPAGDMQTLSADAASNNYVYARQYQHGIAVVSSVRQTVQVAAPPGVKAVYDLYGRTAKQVVNGRLDIEFTAEDYPSGTAHPMGRIFYYGPQVQFSALTVSISGAGTVASGDNAINCGSTCSGQFLKGQAFTLTAIPAAGSSFLHWSGACSGSASTCEVSMTGDSAVTANFTSTSCAYSVSPSAFNAPAAGASHTFTVSTTSACKWAATADASWMTLSPASGYGSATITVSVADNATASPRAGKISAGGQIINVTQEAQADLPIIQVVSAETGKPITQYDFGTVRKRLAKSAYIRFYNIGKGVLTIANDASGGTITGPDANQFKILSMTGCANVPANNWCHIRVRFAPMTAGQKSAVLKINSNAMNAPKLSVPLLGTGR